MTLRTPRRVRGWLAPAAMTAACIAAALYVSPPAAAETRAAISSATLAPATATVGDRLTLTVIVDHDAGVTIEGPGFGADFGGLEPVEIAPAREEPRDGAARTTLTYIFTAFRTGEYTLPPLRIEAHGPDGTLALETPPRSVRIDSVLAPGETELRPLKPQLEIDEQAPSPLWPASIVAAFAALTALGYVLVRRAIAAAPAAHPGAPPPPPLSLTARVRATLDDLAASGLARDDVAEYYASIAATLRRYLSERFGFAAYAMTRAELERGMAAAGVERWPARLAANLLEQCDAVEFAGFRPAGERTQADLTAAYEIVELTSPADD